MVSVHCLVIGCAVLKPGVQNGAKAFWEPRDTVCVYTGIHSAVFAEVKERNYNRVLTSQAQKVSLVLMSVYDVGLLE